MRSLAVVALFLCGLSGLAISCAGRGVGEHCERTGDGFTARHPCKTLCLSIWTFQCKDGTRVQPKRCAGELHCMASTCPEGQVCYRLNVDRSACIPDDICPEWRTEGVPEPVTESDEDVRARIFKKRTMSRVTAPAAPIAEDEN